MAIINSKVNKGLVAGSIINIARECVAFGIKSVFVSSLMVNTQCNSTFISAVNKALKAKISCIISLERWSRLESSGKDSLMSNFL